MLSRSTGTFFASFSVLLARAFSFSACAPSLVATHQRLAHPGPRHVRCCGSLGISDPARREADEIERKYALKHEMVGSKICGRCWLPTGSCICSSASKFAEASLRGRAVPMEVVIYSHVDEFMRKSNTGSLLFLCSPLVQTHLFVSGRCDDERRLAGLLDERKGRVCVVYPAEDAIPLETLINEQEDQLRVAGMTFVLVEGTWRQARKIEKRLRRDIPRVSIPAGEGGDGRMNTMMAFAEVVYQMPMEKDVKGDLLKHMDELVRKKQSALFDIHGRYETNMESKRRRRFQHDNKAYTKWEQL
eukprot:768695-Hanusia_phi.AAC.10